MDIKGTMASLNKLMEEGLIDEAMAQCDKILDGENVPDGLQILVLETLVRAQHAKGDLAGAEQSCRKEVELLEKMFGRDHPHVAMALHNLSMLLGEEGKHEEAIPYSQRELDIVTANTPEGGTAIADALVTLAEHHYEQGRFDVAELQVQRALDIYEAADGHHSLGVSTCLNNLGRIYENRNQNEEGVKFLEEAATIRKDILGTHPDTAFTLLNYGTGLAALDKFLDASRVLAKARKCIQLWAWMTTSTPGQPVTILRSARPICSLRPVTATTPIWASRVLSFIGIGGLWYPRAGIAALCFGMNHGRHAESTSHSRLF